VNLEELSTPCAVVDLDRVERNCAAMGERVARLGARLRPHVKTHKCVEAARLQVRGHFGGITVSTFAEARAFTAAGFRDITCAVPIAPARLREAVKLARSLDRFTVLVDHDATAAAVEDAAREAAIRLPVMLKVDCGYHRAGVDPGSAAGLALAVRLARSPRLDFRGVLTHAGHAYACRNRDEIAEVAAAERSVMAGFAARLRAAGVDCPEVSIGSTPTMALAGDLSGITEARPGNYVFFDAFQAAIGSCTLAEVAFFVLATVIGSYPERGALLLDAGALALSKDPGPRHVDPECGFGVLLDPESRRPLAGLTLHALSQEHGHVAGSAAEVAALAPGDRVLVVPNHSCLAAALHERYAVTRGGTGVAEWRPAHGW